jgi:hypothetical protein
MVVEAGWKGKGPDGRIVEVEFNGGSVTSDAGVLALGAAEDRLKLLTRVSKVLPDPRNSSQTDHSTFSMLCQRVFGICLGYEDLNDHATLRHDLAFQTAAKRDEPLASAPTLCRMENWATRQTSWAVHRILVDTFLDSFAKPPKRIVLDFDATDDRVHGMQVGRHFNAFYDEYIFLPLHVYCGDRLLVSYLRPGCSDAALHAGAVLKILVREIRKRWPDTQIIFRADSGFCRKHILGWCERNRVLYIVGLAQNSRLNEMAQNFVKRAKGDFEKTGAKARVIDSFFYTARSWGKAYRKVVSRVEFGDKGQDCRYVVTNIAGSSRFLYEGLYCGRGNAENHIKDVKLTLFSDRTSCVDWDANQFRVLLSTLAYSLMEFVRRVGIGEDDPEFKVAEKATPSARMSFETIRLRLLKIGGVITRNTRRVVFRLSSAFPLQEKFYAMMARLSPA